MEWRTTCLGCYLMGWYIWFIQEQCPFTLFRKVFLYWEQCWQTYTGNFCQYSADKVFFQVGPGCQVSRLCVLSTRLGDPEHRPRSFPPPRLAHEGRPHACPRPTRLLCHRGGAGPAQRPVQNPSFPTLCQWGHCKNILEIIMNIVELLFVAGLGGSYGPNSVTERLQAK